MVADRHEKWQGLRRYVKSAVPLIESQEHDIGIEIVMPPAETRHFSMRYGSRVR